MRVLVASLLFASGTFAEEAVTTPEQAVTQFRAIMRKTVEERTGKKVPGDSGQNARLSAHASTSLEVHKRVSSTLLPDQMKTAIRVGSLPKLLPDRKVWVVSHYIDVFSGFDAILDAKDGKLVFLWYIPEG